MGSLSDLRILVTGATGFIGSWLAERLAAESESVTLLIRPDSERISCIQSFKDKVSIVYGDIRDRMVVEQAVKDKDMLFHLAAITQVMISVKDPVETFSVNFGGTINLLEAMRKRDQGQALILASTDKVYGDPRSLPITEDHPLIGKSPYDSSKIAAERAAFAYHKTYGLSVSISRSSNVYGGRDMNFMRIIPDFVSSMILGKKITIRGSGRHVRDYLFIDDAVEALLKMAGRINSTNGEAFNFGSGKPTRVSDIAELLTRQFGMNSYDVLGKGTPGEIDVQYLDYSKAMTKLHWQPKTTLEDGLRRTIEWYSANKEMWTDFRYEKGSRNPTAV